MSFLRGAWRDLEDYKMNKDKLKSYGDNDIIIAKYRTKPTKKKPKFNDDLLGKKHTVIEIPDFYTGPRIIKKRLINYFITPKDGL